MAGLAISLSELIVTLCQWPSLERTEVTAVRLHPKVVTAEFVVTVGAESVFTVTVGTEVRIGTRCYGVSNAEFRGMDVAEVIAKFPHFVSFVGYMATQAVGNVARTRLVVALHTVVPLTFGMCAVCQRLSGAVGFQRRDNDGFIEGIAMTLHTRTARR